VAERLGAASARRGDGAAALLARRRRRPARKQGLGARRGDRRAQPGVELPIVGASEHLLLLRRRDCEPSAFEHREQGLGLALGLALAETLGLDLLLPGLGGTLPVHPQLPLLFALVPGRQALLPCEQ